MNTVSSPSKRSTEDIRQQVRSLGRWFHNLRLGGVETAPDHFLGDYPSNKWRRFAHAIPADLRGWSVLDIGCNAGFYSLEMKRRGADRVLGVDSDPEYLAQARFAAEVCDADIEFRTLSVYDLAELGEKFDLVLFMGVFYHLRHPLLALDLVREHAARRLLVFQSMLRGSGDIAEIKEDYPISETAVFMDSGYPRMSFVEKRYSGDPTNWWIPNAACCEAVLRSSGFDIVERAEEEVWICQCSTGGNHD